MMEGRHVQRFSNVTLSVMGRAQLRSPKPQEQISWQSAFICRLVTHMELLSLYLWLLCSSKRNWIFSSNGNFYWYVWASKLHLVSVLIIILFLNYLDYIKYQTESFSLKNNLFNSLYVFNQASTDKKACPLTHWQITFYLLFPVKIKVQILVIHIIQLIINHMYWQEYYLTAAEKSSIISFSVSGIVDNVGGSLNHLQSLCSVNLHKKDEKYEIHASKMIFFFWKKKKSMLLWNQCLLTCTQISPK